MKNSLLVLILCLCGFSVDAQSLKLAEIFGDGAVIQRNTKVLVWGNARPNATVTIVMQHKVTSAHVAENGEWSVHLPQMKEGGPYSLVAYSEKDTLKIKEVYVGEVWVAGGQSNMGWTLEKALNGKEHIEQAKNPNIRFVMVPYKAYADDRNRGDMNWRTATTLNVSQISAVAYFFAKDLQEKLKVPVGIICCYKGGSGSETWMSRDALMKSPVTSSIVTDYEAKMAKIGAEKYKMLYANYEAKLKVYRDSVALGFSKAINPKEPMGERNFNRPFGLYHTMLKRVLPYTAQGAIWYQGEHNSPRAAQYRTLFPALIESWREDFKNKDLAFLFVQLSNYEAPTYNGKPYWAELREAQLLTTNRVKNTGMAVSIDVGDKNSIHPTNKEPVGKRLAACAFHSVYKLNVPFSGPVLKKSEFMADKAILTFDYVYKGLVVDGELKGFTLYGADQQFFEAKASIVDGRVEVSSPQVPKPVAVRYGWSNWTEANLKNSEGFPASPFRTDDYPMLTVRSDSDN